MVFGGFTELAFAEMLQHPDVSSLSHIEVFDRLLDTLTEIFKSEKPMDIARRHVPLIGAHLSRHISLLNLVLIILSGSRIEDQLGIPERTAWISALTSSMLVFEQLGMMLAVDHRIKLSVCDGVLLASDILLLLTALINLENNIRLLITRPAIGKDLDDNVPREERGLLEHLVRISPHLMEFLLHQVRKIVKRLPEWAKSAFISSGTMIEKVLKSNFGDCFVVPPVTIVKLEEKSKKRKS